MHFDSEVKACAYEAAPCRKATPSSQLDIQTQGKMLLLTEVAAEVKKTEQIVDLDISPLRWILQKQTSKY